MSYRQSRLYRHGFTGVKRFSSGLGSGAFDNSVHLESHFGDFDGHSWTSVEQLPILYLKYLEKNANTYPFAHIRKKYLIIIYIFFLP